MFAEILVQAIDGILAETGKTRGEIADEIGIDGSMLSQYSRGLSNGGRWPSAESALLIAEYFQQPLGTQLLRQFVRESLTNADAAGGDLWAGRILQPLTATMAGGKVQEATEQNLLEQMVDRLPPEHRAALEVIVRGMVDDGAVRDAVLAIGDAMSAQPSSPAGGARQNVVIKGKGKAGTVSYKDQRKKR